ncbi:hypothetical protein BXZ70DRAFT_571027 [Cristinia sonorae]|uniref:Aminoglycoside phosphotransferase domain-containing protein n=1 Tax=Cristinia sonorae TaxID=1940300 RepID=A0A8K0UGA6_9AGAR|nr:hypothetical protein BXZ70DRAFT_571027 [Cristinia sonorae]
MSGNAEWVDPRSDVTTNAVNWDVLLDIVCKYTQVASATWGEQKVGNDNIIRFLHLSKQVEDSDDATSTTMIVKVPFRPTEGSPSEFMPNLCDRVASEVATMEYIEKYTTIPSPRVVYHSTDPDQDGVGLPFLITTEVQGVRLHDVWDNMADEQRDIVLAQVVDILLQLSEHRFDKIGALFKSEKGGEGKAAWEVRPPRFGFTHSAVENATYRSGADYLTALANALLRDEFEQEFGAPAKPYSYAILWTMRSFIPAFCDFTLDTAGFPLLPSDFLPRNIFITDAHSHPRISGILSWRYTTTAATSIFAQCPLLIVDKPVWDPHHHLRPRNKRDQDSFHAMMLKAEKERYPDGDQPLSRAFKKSRGIYLLNQCLEYYGSPIWSELYPQLFEYVFDGQEFSEEYNEALLAGILAKEFAVFEQETEVWGEAEDVFGDELDSDDRPTRTKFLEMVTEHRDRLPSGGEVNQWLDAKDWTKIILP